MIKAIRHTKAMMRSYLVTNFRSGSLFVALIFSLLCCFIAIKQHPQSVYDFYKQPAILLSAFLFPIFVGPALLTQDVDSRRILLWSACGLSRKVHYLSRLSYLYGQTVVIQVSLTTLVAASLSIKIKSGASSELYWATLALIVAELQICVVLSLLSAIVAGFWNSVIAAGELVLSSLLLYHYRLFFSDHFTHLQIKFIKLIIFSPVILLRDALRSQSDFLKETIVSLLWTSLCLTLGMWLWSKRDPVGSR